jgi:hypothetical protein
MDLLVSMILTRVEYAIFDSDAVRLDETPANSFHEIDREVRLIDHVGRNSFISWVDYGDICEVAVRDKSFFNQPPPVVRDMSRSPLWHDLIGHEVDIVAKNTPTKHLMITSPGHQICCCCFERGLWAVDVLHIARNLPASGVA